MVVLYCSYLFRRYYTPRDVVHVLLPAPYRTFDFQPPPLPQLQQVMGALEAAGYRTSGMHKEPMALKTDAPDAAVWDILRCWARDHPQPPPVRAAGLAILGRGTQLIDDADFEAGQEGVEVSTGGAARGRARFLHAHNPEQDWGPLARRSVMSTRDGEEDEAGSAGTPTTLLSE